MVVDLIDPVELDWQESSVWVQRAALLQVLSRDAGRLRLRRHDGTEFECPAAALQDHFPIDGGRVLKPRYAPVRAVCLRQAAHVAIDGSPVHVDAGGAVLMRTDGSFAAVCAADYERDYLAVAYPGTQERPVVPFPDI